MNIVRLKAMIREEAVRRIESAAKNKLKELDLSGLGLEELPSEIVKCTPLASLDLSDIKLPPSQKPSGNYRI